MLLSASRLNADLAQSDTDTLWFDLQSLLAAGANVAKLLWGSNAESATPRAPLRTSLQVEDTSALRPRTMRNHYEHIDERLDEWHAQSKSHNHFAHIIGSPSSIKGVEEIDLFRGFDPATTTAYFWGDTFDVQAMVNEAGRLMPIAMAESAKPHWEP